MSVINTMFIIKYVYHLWSCTLVKCVIITLCELVKNIPDYYNL